MDDHVVTPPKKKKKKVKKVKVEFSKYFSAILVSSLLLTVFLLLLSCVFISLATKSTNSQNSDQTQSIQQANEWLTYKYDNFSFKYPKTWANVTMHTYSTTTEINVNDKLIFQVGSYYNQQLQRNLTLEEFVEYNTPSQDATVQDYLLDNVQGKIITYKKGNIFNNIIIVLTNTDNLLTITYETGGSPSDNSIINNILSSFKFDTGECGACPNFVAPAQDWCADGIVVPGEKDECGCQLPPTCQQSKTSI